MGEQETFPKVERGGADALAGARKKAVGRPKGSDHSLKPVKLAADRDEWSRCENGVDQAC